MSRAHARGCYASRPAILDASSTAMNNTAQTKVERNLRLASLLVIAGLFLQLITLFSNHPLAFMAFIFVGSPLVLAGVLVYLWSLVGQS
jgi:hypothetical protein